jgi:hypothetical protein
MATKKKKGVDFASAFGLDPTDLGSAGLFGAPDLDFNVSTTPEAPSLSELMMPIEQMSKELEQIETRRQAKIDAGDGGVFGFLPRYPTIDTPEQKKRVTKMLKERGLNDEQIKKRMAKFAKKGGKVKTSAKVALAAKMLGGLASRTMAFRYGRPMNAPAPMDVLQQEQAKHMADIREQANRVADQQTAVVSTKAKASLDQMKRDEAKMEQRHKEARSLGTVIPVDASLAQADAVVAGASAEKMQWAQDTKDRELALREHATETTTRGLDVREAGQLRQTLAKLGPSALTDEQVKQIMGEPDAGPVAIQLFRNRLDIAFDESVEEQLDEMKMSLQLARLDSYERQRENFDQREELRANVVNSYVAGTLSKQASQSNFYFVQDPKSFDDPDMKAMYAMMTDPSSQAKKIAEVVHNAVVEKKALPRDWPSIEAAVDAHIAQMPTTLFDDEAKARIKLEVLESVKVMVDAAKGLQE